MSRNPRLSGMNARWLRPFPVIGSSLLFLWMTVASQAAEPTIRMVPAPAPDAVVEVGPVTGATLREYRQITERSPQWREILAVFVAGDTGGSLLPVLGSYTVADEFLRFKSRFPFQRGLSYRVVYRGAAGEELEQTFLIPEEKPAKPTRVTAVYPSKSQLPENLLKFYIHFSSPMSTGDSYRYLQLVADDGKAVELPFLELPQELWNDEGTRLTVLFDPGRVKRGLKPRLEEGAVLVPGTGYTLVIDESWPDAHGRPLAEKFEKSFLAVASDVTQPSPKNWKATSPVAATREPLILQFEESLDHAMLQRVLRVTGPDNQPVVGDVVIEAQEKEWRFIPDQPWSLGTHTITVDTTLEDVAGNSIGRAFEVDLNKNAARATVPDTVAVNFEVKPKEELTHEQRVLRNWHQWRGPLANGTGPLAKPPVKWSETQNVKWKTPIPGAGSSTPIVWEDKIFIAAAEQTDRETDNPPEADSRSRTTPPKNFYRFQLLCLDRDTGKVIWQKTATEAVPHEGLHQSHTYAASSPVTDGRKVYVSFGSRGVYCYDLEGNQLWKRDLGIMRTRSGWGEGVSPVLHNDSLVVNWDHEDDSAIFVLNAETGETKWKADRDEPTSWATPLVVTDQEGPTQLVVNATNRVRSYDLATGEVLWQIGGQTVNTIPSPVQYADTVICMSGYRGNVALAIPLDAKGELTDKEQEVWAIHRNTPYVPSPVLYHDLLYFTRANTNVLTCLEAGTGKTIIAQERLGALDSLYASPVAADGKVYFVDRNGKTMVIKAGHEYEVLSVNEIAEPVDASPVVVGNQLLLRSHQSLYCIEDSGEP